MRLRRRDCGIEGCGLRYGPRHRHLDLPALPEVPEPTVGPSTPSGASSAAEPPRPHPAANAWPDDAVTVTYAELRRLVALHLELCSATMPRDAPWDWMRMRAGAVRDGETPLLLSEVMEP